MGAIEIPAFGLVAIDDSAPTTDENSAAVLQVERLGSAENRSLCVNGPSPIPVGGKGLVSMDWPLFVLYNALEAIPAAGETWGPYPTGNQFYLSKGTIPGFVILGGVDQNKQIVLVAPRIAPLLTDVDDTNVTLTISTSPSTFHTVYTLGWSGQLSLARGGTGANLSDPGADRIMFWDDSAGQVTWLTAGSGLTITDTTIAATGGGITSLGGLTGATQTFVNDTNVTIASAGTTHTLGWSGQLSLARGGTGANLSDPNADRILFWDDSAGAVTWLTAGTGLTITDTTITSSGSAGGSDTQVQFNDGGTINGDAGLVYNKTTNVLTIAGTASTNSLIVSAGHIVASDGHVIVDGTTTATFKWGEAGAAPSTNSGTPTTRYGADTKYCGDPDAWVRIDINGTAYVVPAFLPAGK